MNRYDLEELVIFVISVLGFVLLMVGLFYGALYLTKLDNDYTQEGNCENLASNGFETHFEIVKIFGVNFKDCYLNIGNNKSVPYDRYRGFE